MHKLIYLSDLHTATVLSILIMPTKILFKIISTRTIYSGLLIVSLMLINNKIFDIGIINIIKLTKTLIAWEFTDS